MKKNVFFRHYFRISSSLYWKYDLILVFFAFFSTFIFCRQAQLFFESSSPYENVCIADVIINTFWGESPANETAQWRIPIVWFFFHSFLTLITGLCCRDCAADSVNALIIRVQSRKAWWIGSILFVLYRVFIFYFIFYATTFASCCIFGSLQFSPHTDMLQNYSKINLSSSSPIWLTVESLLLPMFISFSASSAQIALSMVFSPVGGVILNILYLLLSSFFCKNWLIYNFTILCRSEHSAGYGGLTTLFGFLFSLLILLISFFLGLLCTKKKDFLNN